MKLKFLKLICLLFGHRLDIECYENHNVQFCLRCRDTREGVYYDRDVSYWTDLEYYGLLIYPLWKIKNYFWAKWIVLKLKVGKLKVIDKNNNEESDDVPF